MPFPGMGLDKYILLGYMQFIKRSSEYFLFFVDWFDDYFGRGGGTSGRCYWLRSSKALSNLDKDLGGRKKYFQFC